MEMGEGNSGSANEEKKLEDGEKMSKLKEENKKANGPCPDQVEKTKGKGLKKWKRRRRETSKDSGHVQEPQRMLLKRVAPHAGRQDTSKGASGGNKLKNEIIESEPSVGNNIVASSSMLGFTDPERDSDSGSWNAVVNVFPIGNGEDQGSIGFPKGMAENFATEDVLNELDLELFETREISYPPIYGGGIELPLSSRAFSPGDGKRPTGPIKKARAERIEGSDVKSEENENDDSSFSTGRVVHKFEGISENHFEDLTATCILGGDKQENSGDLGESSCSTANDLGVSAAGASVHNKAVMAKSGSNLSVGSKQENLHDNSFSTGNNVGRSAFSASGHSKAVVAKSDSKVSLGNGTWATDELRLWYENFDPENSTFERQNNEEALIFGANERGSVSHDRFKEGEEIRENTIQVCQVVAQSEESFASAAIVGAKQREETGDSRLHVDNMDKKAGDSECLVQALTQLQTANKALQQEVEQMKDLGRQIEALQVKETEHSISSESDVESKHVDKFNMPDVPNGSHLEEKSEIKWPSAESQLIKLNEKLKLLEKELEATKEKTLSEQAKVKELEVRCKEQEIKLEETKQPFERTASDLEEKCEEMERELEEQYKQKMQAEMEFLILNDAAKRNIGLVENEASLLQEQKDLVIQQLQTVLKLKHTEGHALSLKDQSIELENACGSLLEMEEVLTLHNKVCGLSLFSFIQFILLCCAIFVMFAQFPRTSDLVPT